MSDIEDLITDIASIVTSVRPREIMSLQRIEDDYRAIYNKSIPYIDYGYSSLSQLLESFPTHFQFSMTDGLLTVRTNVRNNITDLIAKERKSKKPKNFVSSPLNNTGSHKKHKKREINNNKSELPSDILNNFTQLINQWDGGIHKARLLTKYKEYTGYEFIYRDYGFVSEIDLLNYLNGNVLMLRNDLVYRLPSQNPSIFLLLSQILRLKTGYSLSILENRLSEISSIKSKSYLNFVDIIRDAVGHGILSYDHNLVYGSQRLHRDGDDCSASTLSIYPAGVCRVKVVRVVSPGDFTIEIVSNKNMTLTKESIHNKMQNNAASEPLLAMFKCNRYCSFEWNGEWFRVRLGEVCVSETKPTVTVYFLDVEMVSGGVEVSLPTDRLRYLPRQLESVPAFIHRASLAYVSVVEQRWSSKACEAFRSLVTDNERCLYDCFLVEDGESSVSVDIVALTRDGDRVSIFQRMIMMDLVRPLLR